MGQPGGHAALGQPFLVQNASSGCCCSREGRRDSQLLHSCRAKQEAGACLPWQAAEQMVVLTVPMLVTSSASPALHS